MDGTIAALGARRGRMRFAVGFSAGLLLPLLFGEAYLRIDPPTNIHAYLGDQSPLSGFYVPDPVLGARYRALTDYRPFLGPNFSELASLNAPEPTWLFFGNSFAAALAQAAEKQRPSFRMYYLQERKDRLHLRIAQARLLLESGMRPQQMFFTLIPLEVREYARIPLQSVYVNLNGAISYRFRLPPRPWDKLIANSRLALLAWVSSGLHYSDLSLRHSQVSEFVPAPVIEDFRRMFGEIGKLSREYDVPASIVVFPHRNQILRDGSKFVMQRVLTQLGEEAGLRVFDPSPNFRAHRDRRALFHPDWHHTPTGNELLVKAILAEVEKAPVRSSRSFGK
jgi:hypothetical protein